MAAGSGVEASVFKWCLVWLSMVLLSGALPAQTSQTAQVSQTWTVRPEWVKAHEEFLASDALGGRGSATRDEQIAAVYVATVLEGYGIAPAPGMSGYLQTAQVEAPVLDGHATLVAGGMRFEEGKDFLLLSSPGLSFEGKLALAHVDGRGSANINRSSAVLSPDVPDSVDAMQTARVLRRTGAGLVLVRRDQAANTFYTMHGSKTETPVRLAGQADHGRRGSIVALSAQASLEVSRLPQGTAMALQVHVLPQGQTRETYNAMGYLPGTDPGAGVLLLSAHLDHLGMGPSGAEDPVFNGANDDASGTTAVLELAHALAAGPRLRRGVLFVCYGSEELGELGSTYFGEHLPVPLKKLVANLEFEMIGNQDPKMPRGVLLLTGWDRSDLGPELKAHGALLGPDPYPEEHFFERSDNYALALKGVVAHTAAGWGTVPTYHQPNDDLQHLDLPFMTNAIQSLIEPVRWLAESDFVPKWNPGRQPSER